MVVTARRGGGGEEQVSTGVSHAVEEVVGTAFHSISQPTVCIYLFILLFMKQRNTFKRVSRRIEFSFDVLTPLPRF